MSTLLAAVVRLQALEAGVLRGASGPAVHGFWFGQWRVVDARVADRLHALRQVLPFAVSPLMGLGAPRRGVVEVPHEARAWLRVAAFEGELAARLEGEWLPRLPEAVTLAGVRWRVLGWTGEAAEHPWAGRADAQALAEARLLARNPPRRWTLAFETPTASHGSEAHLPFPLPDVLLGSWLRRWQAYGTVTLPEDLAERVGRRLAVSAFDLHSAPWRYGARLTIGCVGRMTFDALRLLPGERAAVDLLAAYAFWAGSGHRTSQGMGMTRVVVREETARWEIFSNEC